MNTWWNDDSIEIVNIDGELYALNGWNGEKYTECWKCADRWNADPEGAEYEIAPVYDWDRYDDDSECFRDADGNIVDGIIGYEVL